MKPKVAKAQERKVFSVRLVFYFSLCHLSHLFIADLRINETLQTGAVRIPPLPFSRLVGTVSNCAYPVWLETAPTGGRKCLFIFRIHYNSQ